jgi:saccharopine dehydrogenase-like NADP-dependent oxidoreductase
MARTTGYTCTAVANLLLENGFSGYGVHAPEIVGSKKGNLTYILKYLKERGVYYKIS